MKYFRNIKNGHKCNADQVLWVIQEGAIKMAAQIFTKPNKSLPTQIDNWADLLIENQTVTQDGKPYGKVLCAY